MLVLETPHDTMHTCSLTIIVNYKPKKIYDSQVQQDLHLQAFIGDKVHIFEETDHWYLACLARNTGIRGIIPKVKSLTIRQLFEGSIR